MEITITTLIENNPDDKNELYFEHGLSMLIEAEGMRILFDTGQSGNFIKNAISMNKDLSNLDVVIISHGHYDHSGGFEKLVNENYVIPKLIVGEEFFCDKFKKEGEQEYKHNGNSFDEEFLVDNHIPVMKIHEEMTYLSNHIVVFHHFASVNEFEIRNSRFYIYENGTYVLDDFHDEIALGIITEKGLVVVVGCSHFGIINILNSIKERLKMPIYAVVGGTHLMEADETRLHRTIEAMKNSKIQMVAVSHCTGDMGIQRIRNEFGEYFIYNNTGKVIKFKC